MAGNNQLCDNTQSLSISCDTNCTCLTKVGNCTVNVSNSIKNLNTEEIEEDLNNTINFIECVHLSVINKNNCVSSAIKNSLISINQNLNQDLNLHEFFRKTGNIKNSFTIFKSKLALLKSLEKDIKVLESSSKFQEELLNFSQNKLNLAKDNYNTLKSQSINFQNFLYQIHSQNTTS